MCTPEIFTNFGPFSLISFSSPHQESFLTQGHLQLYTIPYVGHLSVPYTIWPLAPFKCRPSCVASRDLFRPLQFVFWKLLMPSRSFVQSTAHFLLDLPSHLHLPRFYPAFRIQTNATSLRKQILLSLPPEFMALLSVPLASQFMDCHHIYYCLILFKALHIVFLTWLWVSWVEGLGTLRQSHHVVGAQ